MPQLVGHRVHLGHPFLLEQGEPVLAQADLGQLRELVGELLGCCSRLTRGYDAVHEADALSLLGVDLTPGEDQVQRPAGADQPGQPDRAAVDERHSPATAEDAEPGVLRRDPEVAPDRELEATGDGVPLDGGDHRLPQPQPGRSHRAVAGLLHLVAALGPDRLEVGAGAEGAAVAVQHRDAGARRRRRRLGTRRRGPVAVGPSTALRACGRCRTTVVTGPSCSTRTGSELSLAMAATLAVRSGPGPDGASLNVRKAEGAKAHLTDT